jgi:putative hydrolase of the HAD superfamily
MVSFKDIKLLIVDMDNTLCDTFHTLSKKQWERVWTAFEKRGQRAYAKALKKNFGKRGFVHVLNDLGMSQKDKRFAVNEYDTMSVKPLKLYSDAKAILSLKTPKVLVTRGERQLQIRKIAHLDLRKHFASIAYVSTFSGKKACFQNMLKRYKLKPYECLVIGDRIEEEIKDANELGIPSVLVRRPGWPVHKGIAVPTITVRSLASLAKRIRAKQ